LALRYVVELNGVHYLAVTKLDVLSGFDTLKICTAYESSQGRITKFPEGVEDLTQFTPVYEEVPGWQEDISSARSYDELPARARDYLETITSITGVEVAIVSVGPDREQTLFHPDYSWLTKGWNSSP
jgi:adenylosuccinate synthase